MVKKHEPKLSSSCGQITISGSSDGRLGRFTTPVISCLNSIKSNSLVITDHRKILFQKLCSKALFEGERLVEASTASNWSGFEHSLSTCSICLPSDKVPANKMPRCGPTVKKDSLKIINSN